MKEYRISLKRIRDLMGLYADVQFLKVGEDCTFEEKCIVVDYVVTHFPNADEYIWNDILNEEYKTL